MNYVFLVLTALSVSADSFFGGLALLIDEKQKIKSVLAVFISVLILCVLGSTLGKIFGDFLKNYAEFLGGIILILVGISGLVKKPNNKIYNKDKSSIKKSLLVGISVGLDGAVGSFTLTASGFNGLFVALFITFIHVILLVLALFLSKKLPSKLQNESKIPSFILVFLGLYKLLF
jgi:putative Mn2+ efflux pump MntP